MKLFEVSAFTRNNKGGNLAGVALLEHDVTEDLMQSIAKDLGYSETAYVKKVADNEFEVRFFTVLEEVGLCGHATIATFHLLQEQGLITSTKALQQTKVGQLQVICEDSILMEMSKPALHEQLDQKRCANMLGLNSEDIIIQPQAVEVGLKDGMILVKDLATLNKINVNTPEMVKYSNEYNMTGFHVCAIENDKYYVRNFGPACGIDEESATGTANGSMFVYLLENNLISNYDVISFLQGDSMNEPSEVIVKLVADTVWVGGKATTIKEIYI